MDLFATVSRLPFSVLGPHRSDTCTVDRLNYKYTVIILVIFSIIVSNKQFSSDHIACWVPGHFTRSYEVYSNNICWVSNTYYVAAAETLPLDENKKKTRVVKYYQWTPFILLFQAVLFYLPRMLWRSLSAKSGINIVNLVDAALNYQTADRFEDRNKIMTYLTRSIDQYVYMRKRKRKRFDFIRRFLAFILCVPGRRMGSYLLILFFLTKILFIANSLGQLFLLNIFLGHNFASYGVELIKKILNGEELAESIYFPRVTMCEFAVRNIQNVHVHTVQCVLPINLFNEKAFLFIWFWLAFLTVCNTYDLLAWFVRSFGRVRYAYIKKRLELMQSDTHLRRMPAKEFIHRYLQHDGVLILRLLAYNSSDLVVTELIQQLWQFYKRVGSGGGTGGPGSTAGSAGSSAVIQSSSRAGPGGGRQIVLMNVVRSAGGGGGGGSENYKIDTESSTAVHPISRPTCSISDLMKKTNFSKEEIRHLYRTFKQDSPSGQVSKEHFASVVATLFPTGECYRYSVYLFRNIDRANTGIIRFEDLCATFAVLINGSIEDRLNWIFDLYDLNKDGKLTRIDLFQLVAAVFQLMVPISKLNYTSVTNMIEERTDQLFHDWDINGNGLIYREDFLQYCLQNESIIRSIEKLKPNICL